MASSVTSLDELRDSKDGDACRHHWEYDDLADDPRVRRERRERRRADDGEPSPPTPPSKGDHVANLSLLVTTVLVFGAFVWLFPTGETTVAGDPLVLDPIVPGLMGIAIGVAVVLARYAVPIARWFRWGWSP